jgi:hypothetical protein
LSCSRRHKATHTRSSPNQAEIDVVWESHLKPLLHKKFPQATEDVLDGAEAYAYGGAIIQDLGYYPYGSRFFSSLAHYLRSGDFVTALLKDSQDVDEYAFALGALSHYASDIDGHRVAVNPSVPKLFPKLQKEYGDRVTYEDDPLAHVQTEFGFDVLQVARGRYASDEFRDFIGFEVSPAAGVAAARADAGHREAVRSQFQCIAGQIPDHAGGGGRGASAIAQHEF